MRWRPLLLALLLSGLGAVEPIRVAVDEWSTLNPLLQSRDTDGEAVDLLFDRLVTMDAKGHFLPELLQGWTVLKGGREVVLDLRPGLTWHDGSPIEAEDIVFTWRALRMPQVRAISDIVGVASMDSLQAEGPLRVRIRLKRPRGALLSDLYNFIPVPRRHYQVGPRPLDAPINLKPIGSGPYRLQGVATSTHMKLERWDGYRGVHPGKWPVLEFKDSSAETSGARAILADRFHYISIGGFSYYLVKKGVLGAGRVRAHSVPQAGFGAFFLNCDAKRSLLGDVRLRQALGELIPWEDYARAGRFIPSRLATSFWPPENWAHDATPRPLPQARRAEEILEAAGWRRGADGIRRDGQGRLLSLVAYEPTAPNARSVVGLMAAKAAAVGIRIVVKPVSFQTVMSKAADHEGDIWAFGWVTTLDPDVDSPLFTRDGYSTRANVSSYLNPEVDRLFEEGRYTLDREARRKIYLKISEIIWRDKPVLPLTYQVTRILSDIRVQGVGFNTLGQSFGYWPGRRGWTLSNDSRP